METRFSPELLTPCKLIPFPRPLSSTVIPPFCLPVFHFACGRAMSSTECVVSSISSTAEVTVRKRFLRGALRKKLSGINAWVDCPVAYAIELCST